MQNQRTGNCCICFAGVSNANHTAVCPCHEYVAQDQHPELRDGLQVFDTATRSLLRKLKGHTAAVHATKFSSDKLHVLSGSDDSTVSSLYCNSFPCLDSSARLHRSDAAVMLSALCNAGRPLQKWLVCLQVSGHITCLSGDLREVHTKDAVAY